MSRFFGFQGGLRTLHISQDWMLNLRTSTYLHKWYHHLYDSDSFWFTQAIKSLSTEGPNSASTHGTQLHGVFAIYCRIMLKYSPQFFSYAIPALFFLPKSLSLLKLATLKLVSQNHTPCSATDDQFRSKLLNLLHTVEQIPLLIRLPLGQ